MTPGAYAAADQALRRPVPGGRPLREALALLAAVPAPDPRFAEDLATIRASAGAPPTDPWERSGLHVFIEVERAVASGRRGR